MPSQQTASPVRPKRAFWLHQLAEYIVGAALVAQGLQSPTPGVPAVAGGLVVVNVAIAVGPLGAFRVVGRRLHRMLDLIVIGIVALGAVQLFIDVEAASRLVLAGIGFVLLVIWRQSDYTEKTARAAIGTEGGRSTEIGRLAGRLVGDGINLARRRKQS